MVADAVDMLNVMSGRDHRDLHFHQLPSEIEVAGKGGTRGAAAPLQVGQVILIGTDGASDLAVVC